MNFRLGYGFLLHLLPVLHTRLSYPIVVEYQNQNLINNPLNTFHSLENISSTSIVKSVPILETLPMNFLDRMLYETQTSIFCASIDFVLCSGSLLVCLARISILISGKRYVSSAHFCYDEFDARLAWTVYV